MSTLMSEPIKTEEKTSKKLISDPIKIGNMRLKNRMYAVPMVCLYADEDGNVTQRLIDIYRTKARGGWGLVCVEASSIRYNGRLFTRMLGIYKDQQIGGLNELAEAIRDGGSKSCIQIMHGGRQANARFNGGVHPFAPSSTAPWPPNAPLPREMTTKECEQIADDFAAAAGRAREAGFDCVQLHAAHGFLMQQFMSDYTNQRKDKYGDKLEFVTEVITKVRKVVGQDYPICIRVSADEFLGDKGLTIDEFTTNLAPAIEKAGVDWIDISAGVFETLVHWVPPLYFHKAYLVDLAEKVKKVVNIPVSGIGRINDPNLARKLIEQEKIDIVAFGRQVLADPDFAKKLLEGRDEEINQCIACDMGCTDRLLKSVGIKCAVNFDFAKNDSDRKLTKTETPKKVMVIGGGIAGMEAVRILAIRGHNVTLYEKEHELGGMINLGASIPKLLTNELKRTVEHCKNELERIKVKIELNSEVNSEKIKKFNPDVVIFATGSVESRPSVNGSDNENVFTGEDYLRGKADIGDKVVVVGGNHGAEIALSLAKSGKKVTIIEESANIASTPYIYFGRMLILQSFLKNENVELLTETRINQINHDNIVVTDKEEKERVIEADTVIYALPRVSNRKLAQSINGTIPEIYEIGDCVEPLNILNAINQASIIAREI